MKFGRTVIAATVGAAALLGGSASAEPVKMRILWAVAPAHMTPLLPEAPKGVYKHWGKSYVVEPIRMAGSGPGLQALAAKEIEMAGLSAQALVLGTSRAKLDLRVVAQVMSSGVNGHASSNFYVRSDEIKKLEDLKGKILAVNALGSTIDAAIQAEMLKVNMKPGRDFQVVEVRFPAMLAALESKKIDLTVLVQPFNFMAEAKGKGLYKPLFSMNDALGPTETLNWMARADWIKENRAAVVDFVEDNIRFRRWLLDPKNRDEALKIVAKVTKRPAKAYAKWLFTKADNYRDPLARPATERLQKNIDDLHKLNIVPTSIDVKKYVDSSLTEEAAKRILEN